MICCPLSTSDDGDAAECFQSSTRTARKAHRCTECGETIPPGARYEYTSGIWDRQPQAFKTCASCVEIRNHFACGGGWIYGELWHDLAENFFPDMKAGGPCMEGLSPEAKARLFETRLAWMEDD